MKKKLAEFCSKIQYTPSDITGESQEQPIPLYRAVFCYLMYPNFSQTKIAELLNRYPSSVNKNIRKIKELISVKDIKIKRIFAQLKVESDYVRMERPDFNRISKEIYQNNKRKGFHDKVHSDKHHLCLIVSELMEAIEADRKGRRAELEKYYYCIKGISESEKIVAFSPIFKTYIKDTVEDELADAVIRLLDFTGARSYDLSNFKYTPKTVKAEMTESIWDIIYELVACKENEAVYFAIEKIEELCRNEKIDLWKHVELKLKYNKTRPFRHNK